jgi:phosphoribosyl 1,2-cyclic phosphate phosphodiesterase
MRVTFLGTAAAEGIPALWCNCERCQAARRERGRSLRRRCAFVVDDRLLVDCGPDLVDAAGQLGLDLSTIRTLLVTHPHEDHLHLPTLEIRRDGFCATPLPVMDVYSGKSAIAQVLSSSYAESTLRLSTHVISAGDSFVSDGYAVTALRAAHATPDLDPLFFAIAAAGDGPQVLYAHDTGSFPDDTWASLEQPPGGRPFAFDLVSLDATFGVVDHGGAMHMSISQVLRHRDRLAASGLLKPGARVVANHFSHNCTPAHSELVTILDGTGVEPSFDGLTIDL